MRMLFTILAAYLMTGVLSAPLAAAEMRGLWVDAWHPGLRKAEETTAMVNRAKECNFNTIFLQVRRRGDVYYKSKIEPMASDVVKDYDPLAETIAKAHAAGLKVHAWVIMYEVYHDSPEVKALPDQVHLKHPKWLMQDSRGSVKLNDRLFLDPGVPEVQEYLASLVEEIVTNYDIDGIHLDRASYPGQDSGYNDTAVERFNKHADREGAPAPNDEEWCQWRRDQITNTLRAIKAKMSSKPKLRLSAAVSSNVKEARLHRLEDWAEWLKAGILDSAVPMLFVRDSRVFEPIAKELIECGHGRPVYIGQGGWKLENKVSIEQIETVRKLGGQGTVVYNYALCCDPIQDEPESLMDDLKRGLYAKPATVPE